MNYFSQDFKRSDLVSVGDLLSNLYKDCQVLQDIKQKYYPLLHYGKWISLDNEAQADEFERVKRTYLNEFRAIQQYKFKDGQTTDDIMSMSEEELGEYVNKYRRYTKEAFKNFENENARVLYYLILGNTLTKKQSSIFDEFDIDTNRVTYANWINTNEYYDFLYELVKSENNDNAIRRVFKKHINNEKVTDEFLSSYYKLYEKWQALKRNYTDISTITAERFFEANGDDMSKEFKELIDDILLKNDIEYQKMITVYGDYKEVVKF